MPSTSTTWPEDWTIGLRAWIERAGKAILGPGRLELLEAIERHHSISAAARQIGMSYRHAWLLVQSVNTAAGETMVAAATGGTHGGGARLTDAGRNAVALFHDLNEQLQQSAAQVVARLVQGPAAEALHVAAAVSLQEALGQLLLDFTLVQPTLRVRALHAASDELAEQIVAGAQVDLFISADPQPLERLEEAGLTVPQARVVVAENSLAVVGSADFNAAAIRKPTDLKRLSDVPIALALPVCPLGRYTAAWLERERLTESVMARGVLVENSRAVLSALRSGQAPLGIVCGSDTVRLEDVRVLFTVRRLPMPFRYEAVALRASPRPEAVRRFLQFLAEPAARARLRRCGFHVLP